VVDDAGARAAAASVEVHAALERAIAARGHASLVLSGGGTPAATYRTLSDGPAPGGSWARVGVWFADEREVPPGDPESNLRLARETLIEPAGIPSANVHRMEADRPDLEAAAAEYESGFPSAADVMVLGVGEDGHTASIFPGSPLVLEETRRIAVIRDSPKPPPVRLTITPRALREARQVLVLAIGTGKASAVAHALAADGAPSRTPARLVRDRDWFVDRDAASRIPSG
jgi:6-phosphogluconolactonase